LTWHRGGRTLGAIEEAPDSPRQGAKGAAAADSIEGGHMRIGMNIVGVILLFFGGVWFLQGVNVIHQGFMAGQTKWEINGAIVFVIGILLLVVANRKRRAA
jgi:hypothetical protein